MSAEALAMNDDEQAWVERVRALELGSVAQTSLLLEAIQRFPNNAELLMRLAGVHLEEGRGSAAVEVASRALHAEIHDPAIAVTLGEIFYAEGQYDAAIQAVQIAKPLFKADRDRYLAVGAPLVFLSAKLAGAQGKESLMLQGLRAAFEPETVAYGLTLAEVLREIGRHGEALEVLDEALTAVPGDPSLLDARTVIEREERSASLGGSP